LSPLYRLDTVIGVVDAVHALAQLAAQDEVRKQIAVSDVLVLSKTDLVTPDARPEIEAAVKDINPAAELIPVLHGEIDPGTLFGHGAVDGRREADVERWLGIGRRNRPAANGGNVYTLHAGDIRSFTLFHEERVNIAGLATWLSMLASFKGPQLLRVKGIVNVAGDPYIIQAVQTVIHEPVQLERWPTSDERTRIVFIVRGLERAALEKTFAAFSMPDSLGDPRQIDPAAYARFLEAAKHFM
jgi:G3E family GTPase